MLITFKSRAYGDLLMFEENAMQILDLFGKDVAQGIITVEQLPEAIRTLEEEVARQKIAEAQEKLEREKAEREREEKEEEKRWRTGDDDGYDSYGKSKREKNEDPVPFSSRAYPFLEMLRAAEKREVPVVWGVDYSNVF